MKYLIFLFFIGWSSGQDLGVIEGVIKDTKTGEGLPGVNILIKGTFMALQRMQTGDIEYQRLNLGIMILKLQLLVIKFFLKQVL